MNFRLHMTQRVTPRACNRIPLKGEWTSSALQWLPTATAIDTSRCQIALTACLEMHSIVATDSRITKTPSVHTWGVSRPAESAKRNARGPSLPRAYRNPSKTSQWANENSHQRRHENHVQLRRARTLNGRLPGPLPMPVRAPSQRRFQPWPQHRVQP